MWWDGIIECWDGSSACSDDCPIDPNNCPEGTTYKDDYLGSGPSCVPDDFESVIQTMEQGFYTFALVTIDDIVVDPDDWVGAFNGDVCVGAFQWNVPECPGGVCYVPVMGVQSAIPETEGIYANWPNPKF